MEDTLNPRMRVALLARYLQSVHYPKLEALARSPELELWHLAPRAWTDVLRSYTLEPAKADTYSLLPLKTIGKHDIHRFCYWPPDAGLLKVRPDIIHIEEEPDSVAALQAAVIRRVLLPRARLILFTWQNIRRKRGAVPEMVARLTLRSADYVIAGNREAEAVLRQQGYRGPTSVIPQLGVSTETYRPRQPDDTALDLGLSGFVVGYVGRFVPQKGVDTLLEAVAGTGSGVSLLLVGGGPMEAQLRVRAQQPDLAGRVVIAPSVPHRQVPRYLNAMHALALPSRTTADWKEQFGHVLIEAMACGTPVIGSASGAIPEVIGETGLLFPEGDIAALRACIERLRSDPALAAGLTRAGHDRVRQCYTHQAIAEQTIQVYRAVCQQPRQGGGDG